MAFPMVSTNSKDIDISLPEDGKLKLIDGREILITKWEPVIEVNSIVEVKILGKLCTSKEKAIMKKWEK